MIELLLWLAGLYLLGMLVAAVLFTFGSLTGIRSDWREILNFAAQWPRALYYMIRR